MSKPKYWYYLPSKAKWIQVKIMRQVNNDEVRIYWDGNIQTVSRGKLRDHEDFEPPTSNSIRESAKVLKEDGYSPDQIYARLLEMSGLEAYEYLGFKTTPAIERKMKFMRSLADAEYSTFVCAEKI